MAHQLLMPKLGMTMEEGTIVKWHKQTGETVAEGEVLLEILTDKVNMEVEAPATGQVLALLAAEGAVVAVNTPIAYIGQPGEDVGDTSAAQEPEMKVVQAEAVLKPSVVSMPESAAPAGKVKASPAAKRAAREDGIDLHAVTPTGPGGRIVEQDVKRYKATPLAKKIAEDQKVDLTAVAGTGIDGKITKADVHNAALAQSSTAETRQPLRGLRKAIADNMVKCWQAPHVTLNAEVDMTAMVELRSCILPGIQERTGIKPSYNDLVIKVVGRALREFFNTMNVRLYADGIEQCKQVNVGMAVALNDGLVVPVIENADTLTVEDIAKQSRALAAKAREGKLQPAEMSGGTFTVTNLGMYGIETFTPIINAPEIAILGVGQIQDKPAVKNGEVIIQPRMALSLSFDHRAVDGAQAAQFLHRIKALLEDYLQLI